MSDKITKSQLMIPVYINEKIVLDMLAIVEDGFSMVSQVSSVDQSEKSASQKATVGVSTSSTLLSKLLRIDLNGSVSHSGTSGQSESVSKEKVHTNVSLLSKFRKILEQENLLETSLDISNTKIGDFIEIEGELRKNPLIDYMDHFVDIFRMSEILSDEPELGSKKTASAKKAEDSKTLKQIKSFKEQLINSGTVDFILTSEKSTVVLSAQEQYLSNDNISELVGGRFRVLGKVIAIKKDSNESIDLLRKTSLSILSNEQITELFSSLKGDELSEFNLPDLSTKINGPALIIIPIAIYA